MKTAIVIPVYNEAKHIQKVLKDILRYKLNVIVVDDGSNDNSDEIISKVDGIVLLVHKINLGKGAAMKTGAKYAFEHGYDAVVFMDSDGQHSPSDLSSFLTKLNSGSDLIFGSRNLSMGVPLVRYLGNKIASLVVSLLFGIYVSDLLCGYRALTKKAFTKLNWESRGYGVETEMAVLAAVKRIKHTEVPVETIYHDQVKGVTIWIRLVY
jgi:glycosyltransferase involved in cell wall biosynthesis